MAPGPGTTSSSPALRCSTWTWGRWHPPRGHCKNKMNLHIEDSEGGASVQGMPRARRLPLPGPQGGRRSTGPAQAREAEPRREGGGACAQLTMTLRSL